jgi:hypothetical protein
MRRALGSRLEDRSGRSCRTQDVHQLTGKQLASPKKQIQRISQTERSCKRPFRKRKRFQGNRRAYDHYQIAKGNMALTISRDPVLNLGRRLGEATAKSDAQKGLPLRPFSSPDWQKHTSTFYPRSRSNTSVTCSIQFHQTRLS